jgi:hypothetical protein
MAPHTQHHHSSVSSASFAPYSIPSNHNHTSSTYKEGSAGPNQFSSSLPISSHHQHPSNPFTNNTTFNNNNQGISNATNNNGQSVTYLSRRFVARRISEGETGRLKEELKCQACGKGYKHISSLAKHLWEHTPEWSMTSKLLISKHQQVQLLEAASILVSLNEDDEENDSAVKTDSDDAHFAKLHQHDRNPSISSVSLKTSMSDPDNDDKSSPYTSPSLAEDSSTPSPPPQPLTPQTKYSNSVTNQSDKSYTGRHHSRSDSLSSTSAMPTSPALSMLPASSSMITDSLFPASSSYTGSAGQSNLSSSLIGTKSSLRYDDLLSADNIGKRKVIKNLRSHSVRSYSRRMSALNPPSKVNTNLTLDYDDEEDDENVVVDDLDDDCVFGAMD